MLIFLCDIKGTFLYADLYEDEYVYARLPMGYQGHYSFNGKLEPIGYCLFGQRALYVIMFYSDDHRDELYVYNDAYRAEVYVLQRLLR